MAGEISALRAQLDATREKLIAVQASAAQFAPPVALAAAAGGGTSMTTQSPIPAESDHSPYDELKSRFDRLVIALRRHRTH